MEFFNFMTKQVKKMSNIFKPKEIICDHLIRIGNEGILHRETKSFIKNFLDNKDYKTTEEYRVLNDNFESRIADIYAEKNNRYFYDIEIQCSPIKLEDFTIRYVYWRTYEANDIFCVKPVWFFDSKLSRMPEMHWLKKCGFSNMYFFSYIDGEYNFFKISDLEDIELSDIFE